MKTWLKGGLIGAIIAIILLSLAIFIPSLWILSILVLFLSRFVIMFPCALLIKIFGENFILICAFYLNPIFGVILYFIIGAIIGLIIQKVKKK